jgi:hypothetical protein
LDAHVPDQNLYAQLEREWAEIERFRRFNFHISEENDFHIRVPSAFGRTRGHDWRLEGAVRHRVRAGQVTLAHGKR